MRTVYNHMARELERHPGLLTHYRDDFEVHDYNELMDWGVPGARYLWVARPSGSDLAMLDVNARVTERCRCILEGSMNSDSLKTFLVSERGTTEIDHTQAQGLLSEGQFAIDGSYVSRGGTRIAAARMVKSLGWARQPSVSVNFKCERRLTAFEHSALRLLGQAMVAEEVDLFCKIDAITVDGRDIRLARHDALRQHSRAS